MSKSQELNEFEEIFKGYSSYEAALAAASTGNYDPQFNIKELAAQVAFGQLSEKDREDQNKQQQVMASLNDPHVLPKYLKMGTESYKKHFLDFGKNNLEKILQEIPKDRIEEAAFLARPYKIGKEPHDYIAGLHTDLIKMKENLGMMIASEEEGKRLPKKTGKKIEEEMIKGVDNYYEKNFNQEPKLLKILKLLNRCSDKVRIMRYNQIASSKEEELKSELGKYQLPYLTENLRQNKDNLGIFSYLLTGDERRLMPEGYGGAYQRRMAA
jgi:hypothetical protein